jgi:hypothetical protein
MADSITGWECMRETEREGERQTERLTVRERKEKTRE